MTDVWLSAPDRFLALFERLHKLAFGPNPLGDSGVTMPQLTLLDQIAASPGCGIQEIATHLGVTAPTGLVDRQRDPADRRAVRLFLTAQGQALHRRAQDFRRRNVQRLLGGLTPQERTTLLDLLGRSISAAEKGASHG